MSGNSYQFIENILPKITNNNLLQRENLKNFSEKIFQYILEARGL